MAKRRRASWAWIVCGALYGLAMRVALDARFMDGVMSVGFLVGTPFAVGALSIWGLRHEERRGDDYISYPTIAVLLMFVGCATTLLEGAICLVMMLPMFVVLAWLGAVFMGVVLWLRPPKASQASAIAALPLLLLVVEPWMPHGEHLLEVRDSVVIAAPPHAVWSQIVDARDIHADELPFSVVHTIGVPRPVEGINVQTPRGEVRYSRWEKGISFRGVVTERVADRRIAWRYEFDAHSFPPGSMDDHVAIGGSYFDLHDTAFTLEPLVGGKTRLSLQAHYRVTSPVNFYAVPLSKLMGADFVATILGLYKHRSELAAP